MLAFSAREPVIIELPLLHTPDEICAAEEDSELKSITGWQTIMHLISSNTRGIMSQWHKGYCHVLGQ